MPARDDIVKLQLWSATDAELLDDVRWCRAKEGTDGFIEASGVLEILRQLGVEVDRTELDPTDG